jgi:uncharacterized alpha-E superfamily protein
MSRYVERAENVARFVDVNLQLMLESSATERPAWAPLVQTTGDQRWFQQHYGEPSAEAVMQFLTFDRSYPNSIISSLEAARENARTIRDRISREMWQELNEFYLLVRQAGEEPPSFGDLGEFYDRVKLLGIYFAGVTDATLSRGEAWHFARLGRMLERADKTSRILDVKYYVLLPSVTDVGTNIDQLGWTALLSSASALQMYRQQYHVIAPADVAQFLMLDRDFPRSIRYSVEQAQKSLHAITGTPVGTFQSEAERRLGELNANLNYARIEQIMDNGLHHYLDELQRTMNSLGSAIQRQFFDASLPPPTDGLSGFPPSGE